MLRKESAGSTRSFKVFLGCRGVGFRGSGFLIYLRIEYGLARVSYFYYSIHTGIFGLDKGPNRVL